MSYNSANNKRMAKNTLLMYVRMFVLIVVQLYTVPIILRALGVEDFGIYNVVGGFVTMFAFINSSLVSGCQRFMAYSIGTGDDEALKKVFNSSIYIFVLLGLFLFILIEIIGVWFLNFKMNIPQHRLFAANWVLQFSILSLLLSILVTPFNAAVIAHERMGIYAYASIFESVYKLLIAFCLIITLQDKLILYTVLMFSSSLIVTLFYVIYCRRNFKEANGFRCSKNPELIKSLGEYAGWNAIGALAVFLRNHGLNVVVNLFFSPVMNAAHTIASQINGILNQFVHNVYMATRPQMVKQFASGNEREMWNITFMSSRYAFFLMLYLVIPLLLELPSILDLWLHDYPPYTPILARLMVISLIIENFTNQIIGAFQAKNKIKYYQSVSSIILLTLVPLSYISLMIKTEPTLPYYLYVLISLGYALSLIYVGKKQIGLSLKEYFSCVFLKDVGVLIPSLLLAIFVRSFFETSYYRIVITTLFSFLFTTSAIWLFGFNRRERKYVKDFIIKFVERKQF